MEHSEDCLICGAELVYHPAPQGVTCVYCGKPFRADVTCANGHYVCDACHSMDANAFILQQCLNYHGIDPMDLAHRLMLDHRIKMHGPEHHFLVPAVLLSACANAAGTPEKKERMLQLAFERACKVPGGFCGSHGNCGAGVGTGIFVSVWTGSTPLATEAWGLSNRITALSLLSIAEHGGPRCCKRDTTLAIYTALGFAEKQLGVSMHIPEQVTCAFSERIRECLKEACPYYAKARE